MGVEDRIEFVQANAEELTSAVSGAQYDLIYSFGVIHHTPRPERALAEMRSARRARRHPEGDGLPSPLVEGPVDLGRRRGAAGSGTPTSSSRSTPKHRPDALSRTPTAGARVESSSSATGSGCEELSVDHVFPYRVRDYVQYRYVKEPYFRWMPEPLFRAFERQFGWHLLITAQAV